MAAAEATAATAEIVRFRPGHLLALKLQPAQAELAATILEPQYGAGLALGGPCFTVLLAGRPVACIGVREHHAGRAEPWALLAVESAPLLRQITRAVRGWLEQCDYARVEINVATDFEAGHRWARMLGFRVEGPEKLAFSPSGGGAIPYARIR